MRALTIECDLIVQSMRDLCRETNEYFFHLGSGRVITLSRALIRSLAERGDNGSDVGLEWEAAMIPIAREVVVLGSQEYARIPEAFGRPEHRWMLEFCDTIRGSRLRLKLTQSLKGRESCRRFKELLKDNPEEQNRWSVFCHHKWEETVKLWLETLGILAIGAKPQKRAAA
jgi:hypothetical protein